MSNGIIDSLLEGANSINSIVWHMQFVLLIGFGILFFLRLRKGMISSMADSVRGQPKDIKVMRRSGKRVTSFEAFCFGLGTRVGVGNIAGVATAIVSGGPGAIFWMWVFAVIGQASSFMESVLAQLYKEPNKDGGFFGGPAYYASKGLKSRKAGTAIALISVVALGIGFVAGQSVNASAALSQAFEFEHNTLEFATVLSMVVALIIFSGTKGIMRFQAKAVPFMVAAWIIFASLIIISNYQNIINVFTMIFRYAFNLESLIGGGVGTAIMMGLKRGVFSNEAGLGSMANIAAIADDKHPVKQGSLQALGGLVDTLVVCTFTAVAVLSCGSYEYITGLDLSGAQLVEALFEGTFVGSASGLIVAVFMSMFALTSLLGHYVMAESNLRFVDDRPYVITIMRYIVITVVFFSCLSANFVFIDELSDTLVALMAVINMIVVALLSRKVVLCLRDYRAQRKAGIEEPVFRKSALDDDDGITAWR